MNQFEPRTALPGVMVAGAAQRGAKHADATWSAVRDRVASSLPATSSGPALPVEIALLCSIAGRCDLAGGMLQDRLSIQAARAKLAAAGASVPTPEPTEASGPGP